MGVCRICWVHDRVDRGCGHSGPVGFSLLETEGLGVLGLRYSRFDGDLTGSEWVQGQGSKQPCQEKPKLDTSILADVGSKSNIDSFFL